MRHARFDVENTADGHLRVRMALSHEIEQVEAMLVASALPLEGIADHFERFHVLVESDRVLGAAGLEVYGGFALLRSVVIEPSLRRRGYGVALVEHVASAARRLDVKELYLLTTTAASYFARLGFAHVERSALPNALLASVELQGACPLSAAVMHKRL
jgi:N-acetylglutamate synthase-like GNAT family acetyltransferase